jgi:DNA repair photolyase
VDNILVKKRKITSGTKEWADYNVNCIQGCANNCKYCYAKMMAKRFRRCTEENWKNMIINNKAVEKEYKKYNGRVMFPSSHDIVDIPEIKEACYKVIKQLVEADNQVLITTKPNLNVTKEIINKYKTHINNIQFRFTITSINDYLLSFWEPNAPKFNERKESLIYAKKAGFKTSVSIEPFLDYNPQNLVFQIMPFVTESIWIGPMNYISRNNISTLDLDWYDDIRKNYEPNHLLEIYECLKDYEKLRFKDSLTNRILDLSLN